MAHRRGELAATVRLPDVGQSLAVAAKALSLPRRLQISSIPLSSRLWGAPSSLIIGATSFKGVLERYDGLYCGGGQAVGAHRTSCDGVRRLRAQQQLPGNHGEWDEAGRVHADRCQVFLALGEDPTATASLPDRKSVLGQEIPPFPVLHNLWVLLFRWNIT